MYTDYRRSIDVVIDVDPYSIEQTCGACPTIYEFKDVEGTPYYFRLRWGNARLVCEEDDVVLCSGIMGSEWDGCCSWDDFVNWARRNGIQIME